MICFCGAKLRKYGIITCFQCHSKGDELLFLGYLSNSCLISLEETGHDMQFKSKMEFHIYIFPEVPKSRRKFLQLLIFSNLLFGCLFLKKKKWNSGRQVILGRIFSIIAFFFFFRCTEMISATIEIQIKRK
jgi:hypothetical protein